MAGSHTQETAPGPPLAIATWPNKNTANPVPQLVLMLRGIILKPENRGDRFQRDPCYPVSRTLSESEKACTRSTPCYSGAMKTMPLSIRLDKELRSLLVEGARRTPFNQRELLRRTLRLHLREVIEQEAPPREARITNIDPWPRGCLAKAYRRVDQAWDRIEAAATAAQGRPSWND